MGSNGKNNAQNNGNSRKSGRVINVWLWGRKTATALRASRCQADRVCWQNLRMSLGAIPTLSFIIYAISTNSERAQERNSRPAVSRFEFLVMRLCPAAGDIRLAQARRMEALRLRGCTGND
jgi:hypothetical protein